MLPAVLCCSCVLVVGPGIYQGGGPKIQQKLCGCPTMSHDATTSVAHCDYVRQYEYRIIVLHIHTKHSTVLYLYCHTVQTDNPTKLNMRRNYEDEGEHPRSGLTVSEQNLSPMIVIGCQPRLLLAERSRQSMLSYVAH